MSHEHYRAAQAADDAFSVELRRVYGSNAGDARYKWRHDDPKVQAAMRAKLAADKALWKAQCEGCGLPVNGPASGQCDLGDECKTGAP